MADTQKKQLLLKDLCARLPYNCRVFYEYVDDLDGKTYGYSLTLNTWCIDEFVANKAVIKPYLRPMSSMTEDELKTYNELIYCEDARYFPPIRCSEVVEWLDKNMFDHRGLIPNGLAIKVTAKNNPYK